MIVMLACGVKTVFPDGLRYIKQNLIEYKVSVFVGVPLLIDKMYSNIEKELKKQGKMKIVKTAIKISNVLLKLHIFIMIFIQHFCICRQQKKVSCQQCCTALLVLTRQNGV